MRLSGGSTFQNQVRDIIELGEEMTEQKTGKTKHCINLNMRRSLYFGLGDMLERRDSAISQARKMAGLFPYDPEDPEHQEIMTHIEEAIEKLQKLEKELVGGEGIYKPISTKNGDKYL